MRFITKNRFVPTSVRIRNPLRLLNKDFNFVHYLEQQAGNEFYVYAAIFRWLENLLRFLASRGDYWNKGGLKLYTVNTRITIGAVCHL